jgi:hypothetical protein
MPMFRLYLAKAHSQLSQGHEAWVNIREALAAIEHTKERWWEAEVIRGAGEISLSEPQADPTKAEEYFERALDVARNKPNPGNSAPP